MVSTFRIVLRQEDGYDAHETREFDLELDSMFSIGRASKNISKGYLLPAKNNVYIDSPVVSREHAILTANATSGTPRVYITDTKSMHGTHVNGTPLVPHTPKQLFNGDKLQFGVNVNRNESYFVAFKYAFSAELSNPEPFSRGFTVPEAESEEDEIGFAGTGRGSELDPLILDDSDAESEHGDHEEHEEPAEHSKDNADVTLAQLEDEEEALEIETSPLVVEEDTAVSVAEDLADSDAASTGSVSDYSSESPLVHETQYVEEVEIEEESPSIVQAQAMPVERDQPSATPSMPFDLPGSERVPADSVFMHFDPEIPILAPPAWHGKDDHATFLGSMFDSTLTPPLPPRPSQKRQRIWDEPTQEEQDWFPGAPADVPSFVPLALPHEMPSEHISAFLPAANRIHTPPPAVSADTVTPSSPPSTRSTGVSMPKIVDEQPPTPTSINSRKRSAENAFYEEIEEAGATAPKTEGVAAVQFTTNVSDAQVLVVPAVKQVAPHPQRPIAQPKSILRRALRAAKVMVPATALGAVFTVTALTTLPESFFTVA